MLRLLDQVDDLLHGTLVAGRSVSPSRTPHRFNVPASATSPTCFGIGRDSPVRFDSSHALSPRVTRRSTGICSPARTRSCTPGVNDSTGCSISSPSFKHGGGLGRASEKRADFALRAGARVMLHRARGGKEEQQERAFAPGADQCRAERHRQHQEMNIELAASQALPRFARRIPGAGKITHAEEREDHGGCGMKTLSRQSGEPREEANR